MHGDDEQVAPLAISSVLTAEPVMNATPKVCPGYPPHVRDARRGHQPGPASGNWRRLRLGR